MDEAKWLQEMRDAGHPVSVWGNGPGDRYEPHQHPYRKRLVCLEGSIVFHTPTGDAPLEAGDELTLEAETEHSATVGPRGVRCAEAHLGAGS